MSTRIPSVINERLVKWFGFPAHETHAQVATSFDNHPHVRTMKFYEITPEGSCIFLSHNKTQKWRDLQTSPYMAVLLVNYDFGQLIIEGSAQLKTKETGQVQQYWDILPEPIRRIYTSSPGKEIPATFGVISLQPVSWEMLEINKIDYNKNIRKKFFLDNGSWRTQDLISV